MKIKNLKINKRNIVAVLLMTTSVVFLCHGLKENSEYKKEKSEIDSLAIYNVSDNSIPVYVTEENIEQNETEPLNYNPIKWDELKIINNDIVGWIYNGQTINYPIFQYQDNQYYLKHDMYGNESKHGSIFLNTYNNEQFCDDVSGIYGHHMKDGTMFKTICNYKSQEYFEEHQTMMLYTLDNSYEVLLFGGVIVPDSYAFIGNFETKNDFEVWLENIIKNSTFTSNIDVEYGDKIVYFSTCTYEFSNARYILYGKLSEQYQYTK